MFWDMEYAEGYKNMLMSPLLSGKNFRAVRGWKVAGNEVRFCCKVCRRQCGRNTFLYGFPLWTLGKNQNKQWFGTDYERDPATNKGCWQFSGWLFCYDVSLGKIKTYFHNKMGNPSVSLHLQNLRTMCNLMEVPGSAFTKRPAPPELLGRSFCSGYAWCTGL